MHVDVLAEGKIEPKGPPAMREADGKVTLLLGQEPAAQPALLIHVDKVIFISVEPN